MPTTTDSPPPSASAGAASREPDAGARDAFAPARGLAHPFAQTVFGVLTRRAPALPIARERVETEDGDFLDLDWLEARGDAPARGFVALVHGLEGSARSPYMLGALALAHARGLAAVAMNFRSCSGEPNRLARSYHSGETGDLALVLRRVAARWPRLAGAVIGFSLGANVTLKWLAEQGERAPEAVRGGVAISCPFDLGACARRLDERSGWWLRVHFLRTLRRKALVKAAQFPGRLDEAAIRRASTFRTFDDIVTAPLHGFRDAEEYWRLASSGASLGDIRRPALLLSAEDDPLIPASSIPVAAARANPALRLEVTARGGHVGFVAGSVLAPRFWAEERAIAFAERLIEGRENYCE
jgi:hypothetical protein